MTDFEGQNLYSEEIISAYVDGELNDLKLIQAFETELKISSKLKKLVSEQTEMKEMLNNFFSTDNLRSSENFSKTLRSLVSEKLQDLEIRGDSDENVDLIISKYLDGELSEIESERVQNLIVTDINYRLIFERLSLSKMQTEEVLSPGGLDTSESFKRNLKSLINEKISEIPNQKDTKVVDFARKKENRLSQKVYWGVQRALPIAAVFAFGVILSPTLFSTFNIGNDSPEIVFRGGNSERNFSKASDEASAELRNLVQRETLLRSLAEQNLMVGTDAISLISKFGENKVIKYGEPFQLSLVPPVSGIAVFYFNSSVKADDSKLPIGLKYEESVEVRRGEPFVFPPDQEINVELDDKLLRVDVIISTENDDILSERIQITRFIRIN